MATADFLAGTPEIMSGYDAQGPAPVPEAGGMSSLMAEGSRFATADQAAHAALTAFMTAAERGIQSYEDTAVASGRAYLTADETSAAGFAVLDSPALLMTTTGAPVPAPAEEGPR